MVVLHDEQPIVSVRMLVRAGSSLDPVGKGGLASLAAVLLDQGTTTRSATDIADTIDYIGGALGTGAGSDVTFANVIVMKDSFDLGLDLLSDVIRNPAFSQEELERQRQQAVSGLKVGYEDPDYVAGLVFDRLVYGFHPYGLPNTGTPESLQTLTPADLHQFHRKYFAPNNSILAIVGNVTAKEAFDGAERAFGAWQRREVPAITVPDPPPPTRRLVIVNKPDAVQTEIRVGHIGIPRKHEDFMAMDLAVKILGGEGSNRLQRVLRSERSLTYGASADIQALKRTGDIAAETDTRSESTIEALRVIVDEFSRLQRDRVNERELADAQAYLAGHFPLTIETPDAIAAQVLNVLFYELPLSDLESYRERVNAITPEDIQRVARQYLKPERLSVVLVGNAETFASRLKAVGFDEYELVELGDLDLTAIDFRRAGRPNVATPAERSQWTPALLHPSRPSSVGPFGN
jgi:zinc protease